LILTAMAAVALGGAPVAGEVPVGPAAALSMVAEPIAAPAPPTEPPAVAAEEPAAAPPTAIDGEDELVVTARRLETPGDPLETINAASFEFTQDVDRALVGPVALAYARTVPKPVRTGLRNALGNLAEPVVALNFLLQLKPGRAAQTIGRFAINSTVGVAGLVDVAKRPAFGLPRRPNGFAYTLGYYGVKPGAFLFVPLVGPTTVRDLVGGGLDRLVLPTTVGLPFNHPAYSASTGTVGSLDRRAEIDERLRELRATSDDPYATVREQYMLRRQAAIDELRGRGVPTAANEPGAVEANGPAPIAPGRSGPVPAADATVAEPVLD